MDRDEFALHMDYVARLGKIVAPWALSLRDDKILFTGSDPFNAEELSGLLPKDVEYYEDYEAPEDADFSLVVVGQTGYSEDLLRAIVERSTSAPTFLPQEGFLDELLFGHDWWGTDIAWLEATLRYHPGLQYVKSLEGFAWPSTDAEETVDSVKSVSPELQARSRLNELGYKTGEKRSVRWRILTEKAVPEMGLQKVAGMIAWFCRSRKQQQGGREKYARAIGEWEHDLNRLKNEIYPKQSSGFGWPRH